MTQGSRMLLLGLFPNHFWCIFGSVFVCRLAGLITRLRHPISKGRRCSGDTADPSKGDMMLQMITSMLTSCGFLTGWHSDMPNSVQAIPQTTQSCRCFSVVPRNECGQNEVKWLINDHRFSFVSPLFADLNRSVGDRP